MVLHFLKSGYEKVRGALKSTGSLLGDGIRKIVGKDLNEETLEQLEQLFFEADLGVELATELVEKVSELAKKHPEASGDFFIEEIRKGLLEQLGKYDSGLREAPDGKPTVILVVGVNGNGKTTSVAKLAKNYKTLGKSVLLGAADTFRAAAIDQLVMWAERIGVDIVKSAPKSDPSAVVHDSLEAGAARGAQVILLDTAGRLQTKTALMHELAKIRRVCQKFDSQAPHETLLVIDASTGQNAIDQALVFNKYTPISGIILTKLDGSAKGGIVVAIQKKLDIPIKFIGVGEGMDDLEPFDAQQFINSLFNLSND